jgi:hypothetical protein
MFLYTTALMAIGLGMLANETLMKKLIGIMNIFRLH